MLSITVVCLLQAHIVVLKDSILAIVREFSNTSDSIRVAPTAAETVLETHFSLTTAIVKIAAATTLDEKFVVNMAEENVYALDENHVLSFSFLEHYLALFPRLGEAKSIPGKWLRPKK